MGKEEGPFISAQISGTEISLDVKPDVGVTEESWKRNGWELTPLVSTTVSYPFS